MKPRIFKTSACILGFCGSAILLGLYQAFGANATQLQEVESMIDRLEKKIMQQEIGNMLPDKSLRQSPGKSDTSYQYPVTTIEPPPSAKTDYSQIEEALERIESEVIQLSADVEEMKSKVERQTDFDSFIEVVAELENPDRSHIRELSIQINDYEVFSLNPEVGLWSARKQLPLFSGPLPSGKHLVKLSARVVVTDRGELPIASNVFQVYHQTFNIDVSASKTKKGYRIKFPATEEKRLNDEAKIEIYDL